MSLSNAQLQKLLGACQDKLYTYNRDLQGVKLQTLAKDREIKLSEYTVKEIRDETDVTTYKAVGKGFFQVPKGDIVKELEQKITQMEKDKQDLSQKREYLDRQIADVQSLIKDAMTKK